MRTTNVSNSEPGAGRSSTAPLITRRRWAFWVGLGLFWIGRRASASVMDELAASVMRGRKPRHPMVPKELQEAHVALEARRVARIREKLKDAHADPERRARDGRPPSRWLRSLNAEEIRFWLKTIDVPEFGVADMTFRVHLTRDHSFDPTLIAGLTVDELAKLHSAAHFGY